MEQEYVMQFTDMQKLITNTWKIMIKIKNWDTNILYGWATSQKLAGDNFEWVKDIYNLMKINKKL